MLPLLPLLVFSLRSLPFSLPSTAFKIGMSAPDVPDHIASPRVARQLLFGDTPRPAWWDAATSESQLSISPFAFTSVPHAEPLPRPHSPSPRSGNDLRKNRPAFNTQRAKALVARQRRGLSPRPRPSVPLTPWTFLPSLSPVKGRPAHLPHRLPCRGILKDTSRPREPHARHVSFGDTEVREVDRWIKSQSMPLSISSEHVAPFPPPPYALFPPQKRSSAHAPDAPVVPVAPVLQASPIVPVAPAALAAPAASQVKIVDAGVSPFPWRITLVGIALWVGCDLLLRHFGLAGN